MVRVLVEAGANLEAKDPGGCTALIMVAQQGHVDCVEALLKGGASLETATNDGFTALIQAAWRGHVDCVEALLDRPERGR